MVYTVGDTHGMTDISKIRNWKHRVKPTSEDFLIIAGDAAIVWYVNPRHQEQQDILSFWNKLGCTVLFIDGNHENFDRLLAYPEVEMFGDIVGKIDSHIFHLKRGKIYTFGTITVFTFGGGYSIDKNQRKEFISWWKEEMPCYAEYQRGLEALQKHQNKVDYIITHSCSHKMFRALSDSLPFGSLMHKVDREEDPLRDYFDLLEKTVAYKHWYFGHFHYDVKINDFHTAMYNKEPIKLLSF
jgi:DNA repair exonuclease SbcCD nuclease subunit